MRYLKLVIIIFFIFILSSCSTVNTRINEESKRIIAEIPSEFSEDVVLPSPSNGFFVTYYLNDIILDDNILSFIPNNVNEPIIIDFDITYNDTTSSFQTSIIQIGNEQILKEYEIILEYDFVISSLNQVLPIIQVSDITLPIFDLAYHELTYQTTGCTIEHNRVIYSFPDNRTTCELNVVITSMNREETISYNFQVGSISDLHKIPEIHINTIFESEIDSKYYYTRGTLSLIDENNTANNISTQPISIRLRGNSTLWTPKKSYKIKFDEKTEMLTDYKEKDWVLLANHMDQTLVRTAAAFYLAEQMDMEFSPIYKPVEVFINGEYQGSYLLTDQIEVTNDRVDIEENSTNVDTGFLLEYDLGIYRDIENEDINYFIVDDIPFVIKSPDYLDTHYNEDQKTFIEDYMIQVFTTLKNNRNYDYLIDEETFIDWYIINEVFKNVDSGYSSVYFYKDSGGLLKMGPVWDFDLSSGNYGHLGEELRGPTGLYTSLPYKNVIFYYLMQYDQFKTHLKQRFNEIYDEILVNLPDMVYTLSQEITLSRYNNFNKWNIIGVEYEWYTSNEIYELDTYDKQLVFLHDFLKTRIEWLYKEFNTY